MPTYRGRTNLGECVNADDAPLRVDSEEAGYEAIDEVRDLFSRRGFVLGYFTLRLWHKFTNLEEEVWVVLGDDDVLCHKPELRTTTIGHRAHHIQRKYRKWPFCARVPSSGAGIRSILKSDGYTYGPTWVLSHRHGVDHPWPWNCHLT